MGVTQQLRCFLFQSRRVDWACGVFDLSDQTTVLPDVLPPIESGQQELFGELFFFLGQDQHERALVYARHTGTTTVKRDWVLRTVMELHVQQWSDRRIAEVCGVSRNTVRALVEHLRGSGKLEPVKKRRADRLDRIMEKQLDSYEEGLDRQSVHPREIPVHWGIFSDKRRELEESMEVTAAGAGPGLDAAQLNELIAALPAATEVGSGADEGKGQ